MGLNCGMRWSNICKIDLGPVSCVYRGARTEIPNDWSYIQVWIQEICRKRDAIYTILNMFFGYLRTLSGGILSCERPTASGGHFRSYLV